MDAEQARAAILAAIAAVPAGAIASYGAIAARAGLPKRARLVARVLAELPSGSGVPWHRIVRAGGRIAFAPGSADFARQRALLLEEGCTVADNGRVTAKAQPTGTLDEAIWGGWFG